MKNRISTLALLTAFSLVSRGASLIENVAAVESCRVAITNAIVAKGGTASGALTNAASEIAALPSGGTDDFVIRAFGNGADFPREYTAKSTIINPYSFYGMTGLTLFNGGGVLTVGDYAFSKCTGLKSLILNDCTSSITANGYYDVGSGDKGSILSATNTSVGIGTATYGGRYYNFDTIVLDKQTSVGAAFFYQHNTLSSISMKSLENVKANFVTQVHNLTNVNISGCSIIAANAFDSGTSSVAHNLTIYMPSENGNSIFSFANFPFGLTARTDVKFVAKNGEIVRYVDGSWVIVTE